MDTDKVIQDLNRRFAAPLPEFYSEEFRAELINTCKKVGIGYDIENHREKGRPIRVSFHGDLRTQQDLAAQKLLTYNYGVLSAATAFGKTVVCSYY